jgi:transposase
MKGEGVGPITATALVATVGDATAVHHGRQFAAWVSLVPNQFSTGGKPGLGRITQRGNVSGRTLLIHGARAGLQLPPEADGRQAWVGGGHPPAPRGQPRRRRLSRQARSHSVGVIGRGGKSIKWPPKRTSLYRG